MNVRCLPDNAIAPPRVTLAPLVTSILLRWKIASFNTGFSIFTSTKYPMVLLYSARVIFPSMTLTIFVFMGME